jgi:hypothetical protein
MSSDVEKDEWARIEKNPNNMIVSDVLKDRLSDEYYEEPTNDGPVKVILSTQDGNSIVMKLTAVEENPNGWSVIAATTKKNAIKVIKNPNVAWDNLKIAMGKDEVLREFKVEKEKVSLTVSLPDQYSPGLASDAIITISYMNK